MALTDRYVSSSGAGTYAGSTSAAAPMSLTTAFANAVAGDRINIKADGTYTRAGQDLVTPTGTVTSPIIFRGYLTTPGDGYLGRTNGNGALITTNMPLISGATAAVNFSGAFILVETLNISTATTGYAFYLTLDSVARSCKITSTGLAGAKGFGLFGRTIGIDCDVSMTSATGGGCGVEANTAGDIVDSCRVVIGTSVNAIRCASSTVVIFNTVYGSGGIGIIMFTAAAGNCPYIRSNTIVGCAGDGINIVTAAASLQKIVGNMITDNGGYGINLVSASNGAFLARNRTRDNTAGAINLGTDWASATTFAHVTTDTGGASTDYVNSAGNDYSLIAASPATSAGLPAYASIGALQRSQIGAGVSRGRMI